MSCPNSQAFLNQIFSLDNFPSPPGVAIRILEMDQSDAPLSELSKVISADPSLTAKLIKYCNSPLIGASREVSSLSQAVLMLGNRAVKMLALSFSLIDSEQAKNDHRLEEFWSRSLVRAVAGQLICKHMSQPVEEAFIEGLVEQHCPAGGHVVARRKIS